MIDRHRTPGPSREQNHTKRRRDDVAIENVLELFNDTDCRTIMEETSQDTLSVEEIADRCDIPQSTAYRKVGRLTDEGILKEQVRITGRGRHRNEYRLQMGKVEIDVTSRGGVELALFQDGDRLSSSDKQGQSQTAD